MANKNKNSCVPYIRKFPDRNSKRQAHGNMLVLVTAVTVGIVVAILVFMVGYVRLMGTQTERKTAIESAALTAAREMSRIVIQNDDFGMVGLSDAAPIA